MFGCGEERYKFWWSREKKLEVSGPGGLERRNWRCQDLAERRLGGECDRWRGKIHLECEKKSQE